MREKLIEFIRKADKEDYESRTQDEHYAAMAGSLIANGVTIQKWIPVRERLPEPMVWVLCACRANIIEVLRYDHIMDDWYTSMPNRAYMKGFVTHWMPMPEPPKT